jgi:hypothetical protein
MWNNIMIAGIPFLLIGFVLGYIGGIIYEAICFENETDMETKPGYDPEDPYSCECGNRHPLVERHGKCGSCFEKLI